jgi:hypothetical protein
MDMRQMEAQQQLQDRFAELQRQQAPAGGAALRSSLATPRRGLAWGDQAPGAGEQQAMPTPAAALLTNPDRGQASARSTGATYQMLAELGRASTMGPPASRSRVTGEQLPRAASAASSGPPGMTPLQQHSVAALLSSLQSTAGKGQDRLARLERVLGTIAGDAADSSQVRQAYGNLEVLQRELGQLQLLNAEFARQLAVIGSRAELSEMRRRLEAHQVIVGRWEESLGSQLELVSALQSPSQRRSMLLQFSSAMKQLG